MKVIFMSEIVFTKRDYYRFGLDLFLKNGYEVYIYDLNFFSRRSSNNSPVMPNHIFIKDKKVFKDLVEQLNEDDIIFPFFGITFQMFYFWKLISKSPSKIIYMGLAAVPQMRDELNLVKKIFLKLPLYYNSPKYFFNMLLSKIPRKRLGIRDFDYFLIAGNKSQRGFPEEKTIWGTCLDYRNFLETPDMGNKNQIVFLDEYEPFHPDFKTYNTKSVQPYPYYEELNTFFDFLESKYGIPVVIAGHPRITDLNDYQKYYPKRKIVQFKTVELLRDAKYVLGHFSTSIQMAMLYNRPVSLITTHQMNETYKRAYFPTYMEDYKLPLFNISEKEKFSEFNFLENTDHYKLYLDDFTINDKAEPDISWNILIKKLKIKN